MFHLDCVKLWYSGLCAYMCVLKIFELAIKMFPSFFIQIQVIEDDKVKSTEPFTTGVRGQAPPLVTTNFQVKDQGGCRAVVKEVLSFIFLPRPPNVCMCVSCSDVNGCR